MKNKVKALAVGAVAIFLVACASQKDQASNQHRPADRQGGPPSFSQLLSEMDTNKDQQLARAEVTGPLERHFATVDSDGDGFITKAELDNAPKPERGQRPPRN